jgi:RNA polymerase subunit RPABC4/transcription elongation factor Spt4
MTDSSQSGVVAPAAESCPHCGELVPVGTFCGNCGAHLTDTWGRARPQHYAASPSEHVLRMAIITTLFPHLPRRHAHLFRETFIVGVFGIVVLSALRLYAPALLLASALLPALYLIYLYEVEVWEDAVGVVLMATFGLGALLGIGYSLGFGHAPAVHGVGFEAILLPVVAQLCMVAGPLLLLGMRKFDEALDGLSFGVFAALGFTLASVIAEYWNAITSPLVGSASVSTEQITNILRAAVIGAVVNASTTGILTARIWLSRHGRSRKRHDHVVLRLPAALVVAFAFQIGLGLTSYFLSSLLLVVIVWAIGAAMLVVWLRVTVHHALLEEGGLFVVGPPSPCAECHHLVPTMLFCPVCGAARSAAPKHSRPTTEVPA